MIRPKSTCIFILSLTVSFLLSGIQDARAQYIYKKKKKEVEEVTDSVPFFNGFAVSADLLGVGMKVFGDYGQYEAALRLNLKDRYFPIFEAGVGSCDHTNEGTLLHYKTRAPYFRLGVDYNILKNKHDVYRLYLGARYGFTKFDYDLNCPDVKDPVWNTMSTFEAHDISCHYHWMEVVASVDAMFWGPVHLGWSVRYRNRLGYDEGSLDRCWYVPGFGTSSKNTFGATFNVIIDI